MTETGLNWAPMEAQAWKTGECLTAPSDTLAREWESRKAFVHAPWQAQPEVIIEDIEVVVDRHNQKLIKGFQRKTVDSLHPRE